MIEDILFRVRNIFIGRKPELQRLKGLWELACQPKEHLVYVFLNAPGVGKTTLIQHFGTNLEMEGKGLFIKFVGDNNFNTPQRIHREILYTIQNALKNNTPILEHYWSTKEKEKDLRREKENFQVLKKDLQELLKDSKTDIYQIYDILARLSNIIPVFFAVDEIQEFQKVTFSTAETKEETALHYFTRLLKSLLNQRMLLVLSGTRYHILSQIDRKLGSPIREKVESLVITNFNRAEILEYVEQIKELIKIADIKQEEKKMYSLLSNYKHFLYAFSGGHPRTVERITVIFLNNLSFLLETPGYENNSKFLNFLVPLWKKTFENTLITKEKEEELIKLSSNTHFSIVKKWIIEHAYNGHLLGPSPEIIDNERIREEVDDIIYNLMNLGFIVQHGMLKYYITSYFHFLAFLKPFNEEHELFLKEVLHNKFFELMCGYHSGFGYTFENIFSTALIIYANKSKKEDISIPLDASLLKGVKILKERIEWSKITLEPYILYQTPMAKAVDAIFHDENELLLIQITTARPPDSAKINNLVNEMDAINSQQLKIAKKKKIRAWVVSLFEFTSDVQTRKYLLITAGDALIPILGKDLYGRLREVKKSFSK